MSARNFAAALLSKPEPMNDRYFLSIDLVRGLAALVVAVYHYQHFSWRDGVEPAQADLAALPLDAFVHPIYVHGASAVEVFWTISGFVFGAVYVGRDVSTRDFVVNRVARLYPLHLATLLACAVLQWVYVRTHGDVFVYGQNDAAHFLAQLLFASNWFTIDGSFNGPIWSVSLEVLIYALFWIALPRLFRAGLVGPALMAVAFLALATVGPFKGFLVQCGYFFFAGCSVFTLYTASQNRPFLIVVAGSLALLGALCLPLVVPSVKASLILALACPALVFALSGMDRLIGEAHLRRIGWIGAITYGVYLCHFPVQLLLVMAVDRVAGSRDAFATVGMLALYLGLVLAAAAVSYRLIERPGRDAVRRWARRGDLRTGGMATR